MSNSINLLAILFLAIIIATVIYISQRMGWVFNLSPKVLMISLGVFLLFSMISIVMIMRLNLSGGIIPIINGIAAIGLGVYALLFFTLLGVDIVRWFVKFSPHTFGVITIVITIFLSIYSLWNAQNTKVYRQDVVLPNLVQPLKIAQLSDIHIGHFWGRGSVDKLVSLVEKEKVDIVVITGDLFDGRARLNPEVLTPFKRLQIPIYFIEGNHDGYSGAAAIKRMLTRSGITVLANEKIELKGLQIVGLDYLMADHQTENTFHAPLARVTMQEVLPMLKIDKTRASVLLHHNPIGIKYVTQNGINLYLAGHTHAGQFFPATLVAKLMFKFNKGLYHYNDTTQIYVSQGSGTFGPPMRLGTESEVTILNLVKE